MENTPKKVKPPEHSPGEPVIGQRDPLPSPTPMVSKGFLKKLFIDAPLLAIVTAAIIGVVVIVYVYGGTLLRLNGEMSSCKEGRTDLFSKTQAITDEFNAIPLVSDQPNVKAQITKQEGDCVDSLPAILGVKTYTLAADAGTIFDQARLALTKDGYRPVDDKYATTLNPCSYENRPYSFTNSDHNIEITLSCSSYSANGDAWRQVPVTKLTAQLEVAWAYPKNKH